MLRRMRALEQQGLVFSRKTIKDHDLLSDPFELIMITGFSLFFLDLSWRRQFSACGSRIAVSVGTGERSAVGEQ